MEEIKVTVSISKPMRSVVYAWEGEVDELRKALSLSEKRADAQERDLAEFHANVPALVERVAKAETERDSAQSSLARVVEALGMIETECENSITGTMKPHYYLARIHSYVRSALHRSQGE